MAVSVAERGFEGVRLPFRLRSVVLLALFAGGGWWAYPRGMAAVELYAAATLFADYALCMVGPSGPNLLRDDPAVFAELARRRVVAAPPNEQPFRDCARAAFELSGSREVEQAHTATAWSFVEYGALKLRPPDAPPMVSIADLRVTTERLAELSSAAWPFVRSGYVRLIKGSPHAPEAIHPAAVSRPELGSGLPAWRARYRAVTRTERGWIVAFGEGALLQMYTSTDGGLTWAPIDSGSAHPTEFAEQCPAGDRSYSFGLDDEGTHLTVTSLGPDDVPTVAELCPSEFVVFAAACDHEALVAAFKPETKDEVTLARCPFRGSCAPMELPEFEGASVKPRYPIDIARVGGTTIVAVNMQGIVRVTSTRDDGATWAPFTVAFDRGAHPEFEAHVPIARRLLALGDRVFLYGGAAETNQTYPVLVSDDQGATWREPQL